MMTKRRVLDLFCKATARNVCSLTNCTECHRIYDTTYCPSDIDISDGEVFEFVKKVASLLRDWGDDMPFTPDITEDELLALLKVSAGEGEV